MRRLGPLFMLLALAACPSGPASEPPPGDAGASPTDAGLTAEPKDAGPVDAGAPSPSDAGPLDAGAAPSIDSGPIDSGPSDASPVDAGPLSFTVVTFNTGTGVTQGVDDDGDAWTSTEQAIGDEHYGNGLAWLEAIEGTRQFFATVQPDVVAFQEIFHPEACAGIPASEHPGFVCQGFSTGDLTVAQRVMGAGYQVACNLGKPDKCLAVKQSFGSVRGCAGALCLDGLDGATIDGCGSGSRLGRATIDLVAGGELTVVAVHGNSGVSQDDQDCRVAQVEQVFQDLDGAPAANGARNVILGDLNTDPGRAAFVDDSADRWADFVLDEDAFRFITEVGFGVTPTYANAVNIDHVITDAFVGSCRVPGITPGEPAVLATVHFDHSPIVCELRTP